MATIDLSGLLNPEFEEADRKKKEEEAKQTRESIAAYFRKLADEVESREVEITDLSQTRDYERWYVPVKEQWEFFANGGYTLNLAYYRPKQRREENERLYQFRRDNPLAKKGQ